MTESRSRGDETEEEYSNPYDADTTPTLHRAYREGWSARSDDRPHLTDPYGDTNQHRAHRAWLNGWQAAHLYLSERENTA